MTDSAILVVDDNARITELARRTLAAAGFSVSVAGSAAAGAALATVRPFALVLTDFDMPGSDGLVLVRALRDLQPQAHCVLWSAALPKLAQQEAVALGATVVNKVVGDQLRDAVRDALAETPRRRFTRSLRHSGAGA